MVRKLNCSYFLQIALKPQISVSPAYFPQLCFQHSDFKFVSVLVQKIGPSQNQLQVK